jgi:hypothetical protein
MRIKKGFLSMRPTKESLKQIENLIGEFCEQKRYVNSLVAVIGGVSVIAHGVERVTADIDFLLYAEPYETLFEDFAGFLKIHFPSTKAFRAGRDPFDALKHDFIVIIEDDRRMDFLIARYQWELEGLREAKDRLYEEVSIGIYPKPFLVAMKLKAHGPKDEMDVASLWLIMTPTEREKTLSLAKRIGKDRRLQDILSRWTQRVTEAEEDEDEEYILPKR